MICNEVFKDCKLLGKGQPGAMDLYGTPPNPPLPPTYMPLCVEHCVFWPLLPYKVDAPVMSVFLKEHLEGPLNLSVFSFPSQPFVGCGNMPFTFFQTGIGNCGSLPLITCGGI